MRRSEIVASIIDALKPLGIPLYEWRVAPAEYEELPIIVVRDKEDHIDATEVSASAKHTLQIEIEYTTAKKDLSAQDIREAAAAIFAAIKKADDETPIAEFIVPKSVDIDLEHNEVIVGRGVIDLEVIYYTETWGL